MPRRSASAADPAASPSTTATTHVDVGRASSPTARPYGFYWQLTDAAGRSLPGTVLLARGAQAPRLARAPAATTQFFQISSTGSNDVPEAALRAYHHAEKVMATADPGCQISWTLLAAIGRVESNHGRFGGAQLGADGVSRPEIRGPQLNGAGAFAAIADSDNGVLDRDKVWDRAVGQMQFLPETWHSVARDGDGDGKKNPDDIDDSALGSAVYLCGAGGSLADPAGMARAAFRYNHSDYYVQLVLSFQNGYQTGVFAVPSPPPPPAAEAKAVKKAHASTSTKPTHTRRRSPAAPKPVGRRPKPEPDHAQADAEADAQADPDPVGAEAGAASTAPGRPAAPATASARRTLDLGAEDAWGDARRPPTSTATAPSRPTPRSSPAWSASTSPSRSSAAGGDLVVYVIGGDGFRNADGSFARPCSPPRRRQLARTLTGLRPRSPGAWNDEPVPIDFADSPEPTLGVEWEFALVDKQLARPRQRRLRALRPGLVRHGPQPRIHKELLRNTVELTTGICRTTDEAMDELAGLIDLVRPLADELGVDLYSAGTHPFAEWSHQLLTPGPPLRGADRAHPVVGPADADLGRARARRRTPRARDADRLQPCSSGTPTSRRSRPPPRSGPAPTPATPATGR